MVIKLIKNKYFLILGIILIIALSYFIYLRKTESNQNNLITLLKVKRGTVQKIIQGSGNVESAEDLDIKSRVNGRVVFISIKEGDYVKKGDLLVKLDTEDLEKKIKDSELNLETQKLNLEKLLERKRNIDRGDELRKINETYLQSLTRFFNQFPNIYSELDNLYKNNDFGDKNYDNNLEYYLSYKTRNYREEVLKVRRELEAQKIRFDNLSKNFNDFRINSGEVNQNFISELYSFVDKFIQHAKFSLDLIRDIQSLAKLNDSVHLQQRIIDRHFEKINEIYSNLSNYLNTFGDYLNRLNSYYDTLKSLDLDIKTAQLAIQRSELNLQDLRDQLDDYYIYSPISGYVSNLNVKLNDNISPNFNLMTIYSSQKLAKLIMNEIDVSSIRIGNEAILTFDALPDLRLRGQVIYIDPVGEVSQGVVNYEVKVVFPDHPKVKLRMTVNADIIADKKDNVLIVPNQVIRSIDNKKYVEVLANDDLLTLKDKLIFDETKETIKIRLNYLPQQKFIKTGLSDDKHTEILEGLEENDWIILQSPRRTSNQTNQQQGFFQRFIPQPRSFIRSPGTR